MDICSEEIERTILFLDALNKQNNVPFVFLSFLLPVFYLLRLLLYSALRRLWPFPCLAAWLVSMP